MGNKSNMDSRRDLISQSAFSTQGHPASDRTKSLNIAMRKRENERIERENHKFAKRLYSNTGSISKKQLDDDFSRIISLKKMIQRCKKNRPSYNGRFQQLPPLSMKRAASTEDLTSSPANPVKSAETEVKKSKKSSPIATPVPESEG